VATLSRRTAGNPGALVALLGTSNDEDGLLTARSTAPSRAYAELDKDVAARVLAAMPGDRLDAIEAVLGRVELEVSDEDLRATATHLLRVGLIEETEDGGLRFPIPLLRESLAARLPVDARTALHRALAEDAIAARRAGRPVRQRELAEHLVGAGASFGHDELIDAAEHVVDSDPELAYRWSGALLGAGSIEPQTQVAAAAVAARACYALAHYRQAIDLARAALAALPEDNQRDTLTARTVLVNSLIRTGQHGAALDVTADPEAAGAVVNGLQQARIALLGERFDDALAALAQLRPAAPNHQAALLAGVRILAAISADGVAWRAAEHETTTPLPDNRLEQARHALAWGDLFTAERGIIAGAHPSPAARRQPPPSLGRLSAAVTALRVGEWSQVRAIADEHAAADEEVTHVDGIIAALAAETWLRQDQPARAAQLLADVRAEQLFGHVIGWAAAGVDLARDRPGPAVAALAELDQRCRRLGYLTGRELVLSRKVDAELATGDRQLAERTADELGELCARINTRQARLYWLLARLAIRPTERVTDLAAQLADELGDRFLAARVQLSNADTLRSAYGTFRELGAVRWQKLAADRLRDNGITVRPPTVLAEADRRLIEMIAAGATNGDVAAALGVTEKAVEGRLTRLYRRTGLRGRADLVREYGGRRDAG
jgi:DNA-binding CsgD family transcriptional regulator